MLSIKTVLAMGAVLALCGMAQAAVVYQESFDLGQTLSAAGWSGSSWHDGSAINADPTDASNGKVYMYHGSSSWEMHTMALYSTEAMDINTAAPVTVSWRIMNHYDNWRAAHYLAVQVGGSWYVSTIDKKPINNPNNAWGYNSSPADDIITQIYDPAAANWKTLTFEAGSATIGTTASAPLSGNITGLGMVWSGSIKNFQLSVDYFKVDGTVAPEPATMSLLAIGGLAALIRRRK